MANPLAPVVVFSGGGTGGHLYPALALAESLTSFRSDVRLFFVGARRGLEARILPERGVEHVLLPVEGFRRGALAGNLKVLAALVRSLVETARAFTRLRPQLVVVTGGYAGGPAGLVAGLMGIPLVLQEQNAYPGITTRVLSRWSRQVHVAFPEALEHLPRGARARARVSGNPIRTPQADDPAQARAHFGLDPRARAVLVTGGSQGAEAINRAVLEAVEEVVEARAELPPGLQLLWVTGPRHIQAVRESLAGLGNPSWVHPLGFTDEMPRALHAATLAVSRAGAMTTSEFLAWGVPAVLIPLPTAAADHQRHNAESLQAAGAALHLPEDRLTGAVLWGVILDLLSGSGRLEGMRQAALERGRPAARDDIARELCRLLPPARRAA